ncbi:SDR family oxidoreductase [Streptomyces sp. NPDC058614]|uniref:SDR family oxidoreductase n=1 Tax=Streptomyces sp. NPDC058614 TaxID=3346557 RepID=UPI00365C0AAB
MSRLKEKVALVSGGAGGIGAAIARAVVVEGGQVVIGDLQDAEGQALAEAIGPAATYVHLDVTKPTDWESAVATAVDTYGRLNTLVNNAGIANFGPIDAYTHADWDAVIAVNLTGVFNGMKAAIPALKQATPASIVNMSSVNGLLGAPWVPGYVASKFGVVGLTKAAALDLGRYGIRVNSVHPGFITTPMTAGASPDLSQFALGRAGDPAEIARLVVFLASDESSFSTGAEFIADGGLLAGISGPPPMEAAPEGSNA